MVCSIVPISIFWRLINSFLGFRCGMTMVSNAIAPTCQKLTFAEVANNAYRDGYSNLNNTEESSLNDSPGVSVDQRRMNSVRAYFEWMPLR